MAFHASSQGMTLRRSSVSTEAYAAARTEALPFKASDTGRAPTGEGLPDCLLWHSSDEPPALGLLDLWRY